MIIKSMSRKKETFSQLMEYVTRDEISPGFEIYHNAYDHNPDGIIKEFKNNAKIIRQRKNGNILYHEILSITRVEGMKVLEQKQKLKEIAEKYLIKRAGKNIAFAALHDDKEDNLHYHFIISANEAGREARHVLSKSEFRDIQIELEHHVRDNYPELEQRIAMDRVAEKKISRAGAELLRRTGQTPRRQNVIDRLEKIFSAQTQEQAVSVLEMEGLQFYQRGKAIGVINLITGQKHRLTTLGVMDQYNEFKDRVQLDTLQRGVIQTVRVERKSREQKQQDIVQAVERKQAEQALREAERLQSNTPEQETEKPTIQPIEPVITPDQVRAGLDAEQTNREDAQTPPPGVSEAPSEVRSETPAEAQKQDKGFVRGIFDRFTAKEDKTEPWTQPEPEKPRHRARPEPQELPPEQKNEAESRRERLIEQINRQTSRARNINRDKDHDQEQ